MPAQHQQQGQLDAGNDASVMLARAPAPHRKNTIAALARPLKVKLLWADAGYSGEATGDNDERDNDASQVTYCDCIMTGQMPFFDTGGNAGVTRATMPV